MEVAAKDGGWVLLQNCELGLGLMNEMEVLMGRLIAEGIEDSFRLFQWREKKGDLATPMRTIENSLRRLRFAASEWCVPRMLKILSL